MHESSAMGSLPQVVGIGYSVIDYLGVVPTIPAFDDPTVTRTDFRVSGGGQVATALVTLARLRARAAYIGVVGDDDAGHHMRDAFVREGVDVSAMRHQPGARSHVSLVLVDQTTAKRAIMTYRGACSPLELDETARTLICGARFLHLDGHEGPTSVEAARLARAAGARVCLDVNKVRDDTAAQISLTDVLIVPESFASTLTGAEDEATAARALRDCGPEIVVLTRGKDGCLLLAAEGMYEQGAFPVTAVDTTGAGDVFHGAFTFGLLQGWNPQRTARFASAVSALKCTVMGGRTGIPTLAEVEAFLARHPQAD